MIPHSGTRLITPERKNFLETVTLKSLQQRQPEEQYRSTFEIWHSGGEIVKQAIGSIIRRLGKG